MTLRPTAFATGDTSCRRRARLRTAWLLAVLAAPLGAPLSAWADTSAPAVAPPARTALPSPTPPISAAARPDPQSPARVNTRGEPVVQQRVLEDEHILIEELVVRGQPVRISVRGKTPGARGYEVNVGPGGRDASQESGRAGQSAWRLFSF